MTIPKYYYGSDEIDEEYKKKAIKEQDEKLWKVQSVHSMPLTNNLIAVSQKNHREFCFVAKPAPGSR